jgi:cell wall-associated NlpC family hydrolase
MKPIRLSLWCAPLALALLLVCQSTAAAQCGATTWTSVEGRTIRAQLYGMDRDHVILHMRGKTYRVPVGRLTPQSREQAARLLRLPSGAAKAAGLTRSSPVPVAAKGPNRMEPSSPDGLAVSASAGLDEDLALPDREDPMDPDGSVLPARGSIQPKGSDDVPDPSASIRFDGTHVLAPSGLPSTIIRAIEAGNCLQTKSYKWGGGRARLEDSGYDCSGSVSYVLIKAGLLRAPLNSGGFTRYGAPGKGRWITIHARNGHVFMTICGLRLDTGGSGGRGESGPRWRTHMRGTCGFVMRHPPGF